MKAMSEATQRPPGAERSVRQRSLSLNVLFALNGLGFAAFAARVPALQSRFDVTTGEMGLLLLCLGAGALVSLPAAGWLCGVVGVSRSASAGVGTVCGAYAVVGAAAAVGNVAAAGAGLVAVGVGTSVWDVAMNVEGSRLERASGRVLLPRFHAWFGIGTMFGAGVGAGFATTDVAVSHQLWVTAPLIALVGVWAAMRLFAPAAASAAASDDTSFAAVRDAWRDRRNWLLGGIVVAFALSEGVANDWLALTLRDDHGFGAGQAAVGFGVFVTALTAGRYLGDRIIGRIGVRRTLLGSAAAIAIGVSLVSLTATPGVTFAGIASWGSGTALGFPIVLRQAGADQRQASANVSMVSAVAYSAFLVGPPAVGFLADSVGLSLSLLAPVVLVGVITVPLTQIADLYGTRTSQTRPTRKEPKPMPSHNLTIPQGDLRLLHEPTAQDLLAAPIPARLAYIAHDGTPRIVPSWFHWDGDDIVTATWVAGPHVRRPARRLADLSRSSDVAVSIDTDDQPARLLQIRGTAQVDIVDGIADEYRHAAHRYLGDAADDYLDSVDHPDVAMARIAVRPTWVGLIDFEQRPPEALSTNGAER